MKTAAWSLPWIATLSAPAFAWNPYPDYSAPPPNEARPAARGFSRPMTTIYTPDGIRPAPPSPNYAPAAAPFAKTAAPAPAMTVISPPAMIAPPAYTPPPAAPVYVAPPPAVAAVAEPISPFAPPPPAFAKPASAPTQVNFYPPAQPQGLYTQTEEVVVDKPVEWRVGAELFHDTYQEPDIDMETRTIYGSLTGSADWFGRSGLYLGGDARMSYGRAEYESPSGKISQIPEQEYEGRFKIGYSMIEHRQGYMPYTGLGMRYFRQELGGETTDTGAVGYDRNIFQLYMPFGWMFEAPFAGWQTRSFIEVDALLWGSVSSRLEQTGLGLDDAVNHQKPFSGGGIRGEIMFSDTLPNGSNYEFGPFFRYWNIGDSETDNQAFGTLIEPENERMQIGAEMRYRF